MPSTMLIEGVTIYKWNNTSINVLYYAPILMTTDIFKPISIAKGC